ncbi:hypothetical protein IT570_01125 [Candidatus Sumerlaeota bacterium]|nr:hypothetical protein [Candidatus Sumerlaeota bacterium]
MFHRWLALLTLGIIFFSAAGAAAQKHPDDPDCVIVGDTAATLAPGLNEQQRRAALAALPANDAKYVINSRWTWTTNNPTVTVRTPFTLTYSFVPDGTLATANGQTGVSSLFAATNGQFPGGSAAFKALVREALDEWGNRSGITYVETTDDGAPLPSSSGVAGVRGDVRISMYGFGGSNNGFLAFNTFPNQGDLVMNANYMQIWYAVPTNNFRRLRNTVAHEHGHGLGFTHVIPQNNTKLMESTITDFYDGLTEDELRGLPRLYGDWAEVNDSLATARDLSVLPAPTGNQANFVTLRDLALEGGGLTDYFRFNIPAFKRLTARVTPIGDVYQSGPSGGFVATIDGLRVQNLRLEILSPSGSVVQTAASAPSGAPEEIANLLLLEPGGYHARVSATDGADDVQRYELQLGYVDEPDATILLGNAVQNVTALPGTNAGDRNFTIRNDGAGLLSYTIRSDVDWMSAIPASGSATTETDTITIRFATSNLAAGNHVGNLTVSAPNTTNAEQTVTVNLRIAPPILSADRSAIVIAVPPGTSAAPEQIVLANSGLGSINYTLAEDSPLISLTPTNGNIGTERDTITVQFSTSGLATGTFSTFIHVNSDAPEGDFDIPVRITVTNLNGWALVQE